jgi:sugar phosphate isomerase/epimerase
MTRTAIQLITVRDLDEPFGDTLDRIAGAGYDGVQLRGAMPDRLEMEPAEIREMIESRGLDVVAPFVYDLGEDAFADTVATLDAYGTSRAAHGFGPDRFDSADAVENVAGELDRLADRLGEHGIELCCHNHDHEFVNLGSRTAYDLLLDRTTRTQFVLDVGWALAGGADPVELLERMGERVPLLHVKDYDLDREEIVELGEGDVDLAGCARAARERGAEWLIYEHDYPDDPAATIDRGASFLDSL